LENPAELEKLRAQPSLLPAAVEEFGRYYSPVEYSNPLFALADVESAGVTIPKGNVVIPAIGAANRDERQFRNPDVLDIEREPNRHLAFGQGIHYCLGAPLARLEAQVAFRTLLDRFSDLQLAVPREQLKWRESTLLRGLESLPVRTVAAGRSQRSSA
jgi:cytochrome P450 PksS